jgi:hypothetical protein
MIEQNEGKPNEAKTSRAIQIDLVDGQTPEQALEYAQGVLEKLKVKRGDSLGLLVWLEDVTHDDVVSVVNELDKHDMCVQY